MKNKFKILFLIFILSFCFIGIDSIYAKECYELTTKKTCVAKNACAWVSKKCHVATCTSVSTSKKCSKSTDMNKNSCKWSTKDKKCCPDGNCAATVTNKVASSSSNNSPYNSQSSTTSSSTWKCVYDKLDSNGKTTGETFTISPSGTAYKLNWIEETTRKTVEIYDTQVSDPNCHFDFFKVVDQYIFHNDVCKKFDTKHNWTNQNYCSVYIYNFNFAGGGTTYLVAGDTDPGSAGEGTIFKIGDNKFKYLGKLKEQFNSSGVSEKLTHSESSLSKNLKDLKEKYPSFYDKDVTYKKCENVDRIPTALPTFTNALYKIIKFLVPIVLVLMGMKDFVQAMISKDENQMKEQQNKFIRRLIAAVVIFFVVVIIEFLINLMAASGKSGALTCIKCFVTDSSTCEDVTA